MDSERDPQRGRDITRYLSLLRNVIHESGWTQLEVQAQLCWGRSYISQLITGTKALRVDQVLSILKTIDVSPGEFFARLYRRPRRTLMTVCARPSE